MKFVYQRKGNPPGLLSCLGMFTSEKQLLRFAQQYAPKAEKLVVYKLTKVKTIKVGPKEKSK